MPNNTPTEKTISSPRKPVPEDGIGERIKDAREAREWTQSVLSVRTKLADPNKEGVSRTVLVGYESGKYKPGAREIRLLAEALHVTPNWLLYGMEKPFRASLPSMEFLQGDDEFDKAIRIAVAMLLLKPHEREIMGSLLLSLAGRELGDLRLSGVMCYARSFSKSVSEKLLQEFGTNSVEEVVRMFSEDAPDSNWGTKLRFDEGGDYVIGTPLYPAPPEKK